MGAPAKKAVTNTVYISALDIGGPGEKPIQEYVTITNKGKTDVSMKGWKIKDEYAIHTYSFASSYKLKAKSSVTLKSGKGSNSAKVLYWNKYYFIWNNYDPDHLDDQHGDIAYLYNAQGKLVSSKDMRHL